MDLKSGKVGLFDINEGIGPRTGNVTGDDELMEAHALVDCRKCVSNPVVLPLSWSRKQGVCSRTRAKRRGSRTGLIATVADVKSAYGESEAQGNARLARVGVDWAGFEVGTLAGSRLATALTVASKVKVPCCGNSLGRDNVAGFGGSYIADKQIGERLEHYVGRKPDA